MTPLSKQPKYAEAASELQSLAVVLGKVEGRITQVEALMRVGAAPDDRDSSHVEAAVAFAETGKVLVSNVPTKLAEEHVVLRQQREALQKAMRARQEAMHLIAGELSVEIGRELAPNHRKLAGKYVKLLKALDACYQEEQQMVRDVESAGYSVRIAHMIRWPYIGMLSQHGESALFNHLREFAFYATEE